MTGIEGEASGTFEVAQAPLISPFKFIGRRMDAGAGSGPGTGSRPYKVAQAIMTGIGGVASGAMKPIVTITRHRWFGLVRRRKKMRRRR